MQQQQDDKKRKTLSRDKDEKLTFRKPRTTPLIEPIAPSTAPKSDVSGPRLREVITVDNQDEKTSVPVDEPMKMFFYYPKYLHPEAVTLIAQNLLQEWENESRK